MNSPQCGSEAVSDGTRMAATLSPPGGVTGKARIRVPASNASTGAPRSRRSEIVFGESFGSVPFQSAARASPAPGSSSEVNAIE